ncbi:MAG: Gfo/Idh/MocA family oxidoreductase [Verrucomicrobia bacterium]|nr:Gfo/Idh/MocA family oxidoreductase [Verrucomicrobiota bacterium]
MKSLPRRRFLGAAAAGAAALSTLRSFAADSAAGSAGRIIKLGLIGCGGYGLTDVRAALKAGGVEVVALCDIDSENLAKVGAEVQKLQGKPARGYKLYEELLAHPGLEAVIIATPPHWHALQLIAAVNRGLDVYCEKPLSYDVREGRAMVEAAERSGRTVQIGFQRRQSPAFQAVRQFIAEGRLGRVVQAEAQIFYTAGVLSNAPQPPPASLDWDLWCGPGPLLPYSPQVGHRNWRLEKSSGQGHLYDWGIHLVDAARTILGVPAPRAVSASGGIFHLAGKITTPDTLTAQFEFERCPLTWRHRLWGAEEHTPEVNNGIFFYGEKGTVFVTDARWSFTPRGKNAERQWHEAKADMGQLHMQEFLEAVRQRRPAPCGIADAHLSTTTVKLGMVAYEAGVRIAWDAAKEEVIGNPAAAKWVRRDYRKPWVHPGRA